MFPIRSSLVPRAFALSFALGLAATAIAVWPTTTAYSPYTFTATYTINDVTGAVSYAESGTFTTYPICASGWQDQPSISTPITSGAHQELYKFDNLLKRWSHEAKRNFVSTIVDEVCPGGADFTSENPDCSFTVLSPSSPISNPLSLPNSGWNTLNGTEVSDVAHGANQIYSKNLDLSYSFIHPVYNDTGVPFTGRFYYKDYTHGGGPGHSGSMVAGRCVKEPAGTPHFQPGLHRHDYGAESGIIDGDQLAMVPGYGPIGPWRLWLMACNIGC